MHRYVNVKKVNGFKGELVICSDGDYDIIDDKLFTRLSKAKDYIVADWSDDINIRTKEEIIKNYREENKERALDGEKLITFEDWLKGFEILFIIIKDL